MLDLELLTDAQHLGSLMYSPEQTAQVLDLTPELVEELNTEGTELYRAYWTGWYEADIKIRNSIFDLAARGSSPAQAMALSMKNAAEARRYYGG